MYRTSTLHLSHDQVEVLATLAEGFHLRPGPGGSTASVKIETEETFRPRLGETFPGTWTNAMVMALWPSSQVVAHCDPPIVGRRHHLPLRLNDGCWVFHNGDWRQLEVGTIYEMDPTELHGAVNWGTTLRLHLVIDTV